MTGKRLSEDIASLRTEESPSSEKESFQIYWKSPYGSPPPAHAVFGWLPFLDSFPLPSIENIIRVHDLPPPLFQIPIQKTTFLPDKPAWITSIEETLKTIQSGILSKVVLARSCVFECVETVDPFAVAAYLQNKSQNSTVFCFANETMAFVGASPEILFQRKHRIIQSDIIAGTARRGSTPEEDLLIEKKLLQDPKMLREWKAVQTFLKTQLASLCVGPLLSFPLHVKKTSHVQHLSGQIQGTLLPHIKDEDILQKIHPTPALCGTPTNRARNWILQQEPFSRGLYGGAVGWSTQEESEWVVAIRSCLIQNSRVTVCTGAGIVEGSQPEEEWEELNHKMALYKDLFT